MRFSPELLSAAKQASDVMPGNIYPAKGGRKSPGTEYWLVIATTEHGAACIGFDAQGRPVSTATYLRSAMRERPLIGRVDLNSLQLNVEKA